MTQADEPEVGHDWHQPTMAQDHAEEIDAVVDPQPLFEPEAVAEPEITFARPVAAFAPPAEMVAAPEADEYAVQKEYASADPVEGEDDMPAASFADPASNVAPPAAMDFGGPKALADDEGEEIGEDEVLILDNDDDAWRIDEGPVEDDAPFAHAPVEDREARDEIAELRAEVVGLRAAIAQLSVQPARESVDPQALRDCLTIIDQRLNTLEQSAQEQENALRKVLGMLIDWVEREERMTGSAAA